MEPRHRLGHGLSFQQVTLESFQEPLRLLAMLERHDESSSAGESEPHALTETDVNLDQPRLLVAGLRTIANATSQQEGEEARHLMLELKARAGCVSIALQEAELRQALGLFTLDGGRQVTRSTFGR